MGDGVTLIGVFQVQKLPGFFFSSYQQAAANAPLLIAMEVCGLRIRFSRVPRSSCYAALNLSGTATSWHGRSSWWQRLPLKLSRRTRPPPTRQLQRCVSGGRDFVQYGDAMRAVDYGWSRPPERRGGAAGRCELFAADR